MRPILACTALVAALGGGGCIIDAGPDLRITELRVMGTTDWSLLDVEVHLFDADTREYLGCSGQYEGLENVDVIGEMYHLDAWFREPAHDVELQPSALDHRRVEIQVIEDDLNRCPTPPQPEDDMFGISPPVDRALFELGPMLSFDDVMDLRIVID